MKNIVGLCLVALILGACSNKDKHMPMEEIDVSKEVAEDVVIYYSDSARLRSELSAPVQWVYELQGKHIDEYPEGLVIKNFNDQKEIISYISGQYAKWNHSDGLLRLRDNVVLTNPKGDKITSSRIDWDQRKGIISTEKFIQLVRAAEQDTLYGVGFIALEDFSQFNISKPMGKSKSSRVSKQIGLETR